MERQKKSALLKQGFLTFKVAKQAPISTQTAASSFAVLKSPA